MCVGVEVVTTWVAQQSPLECVRRRRALIEVSNCPEDVEEEEEKKNPDGMIKTTVNAHLHYF